MAIYRHIDQDKGTARFTYKGEPITPEFNMEDPKEIFEVLSNAIDNAYNKIRDAGIE